MPYVITTKRPIVAVSPFASRGSFERDSLPVVSQRAVEALEILPLLDALQRLPALPIKSIRAWAETLQAVLNLPEEGGAIHLPDDGTLLEVERQPDGFDVDAFNARHS
jgi:hypothetical protein